MAELRGKRVAFLLTAGFEDVELTGPWQAVTDAGATATLISPESESVTGKNGHEQRVDQPVSTADSLDYDALILPGGVVNADHLRMDEDAVAFAQEFFQQNKPVGVICHGAWVLIESGVLAGRTLTSYPSLRTDLRNAGATWVDKEVVVDRGLISSRNPDDIPAFNVRLIEEFAGGPSS